MTKRLKIVGELTDQAITTLLVHMPEAVVSALKIECDGTIDTQDFVNILQAHDRDRLGLFEHRHDMSSEELMHVIFDPTLAADFKP